VLNDRRLIDANEASRVCGLSKATLYKLVHQGRLTAFKVLNRTVRFDSDDIRGLIQKKPATVVCHPGIGDITQSNLPTRGQTDGQTETEVR
jgi:excisionase family DNA binding protein